MIGVLLGTAVLTGCSEKQEASETLPSSTAAETSEALPELGPADFPVPDEARTKDAEGAEAFLRYWIDLLNRQQAIPDGQPLRDLSTSDCYECLRIAKAFDDASASGWRYEGGELSLNDLAEPQVNGNEASLVFGARVEALTVRDSSGAPVPGGTGEIAPNAGSGVTLVWSERRQHWSVAGMTIG
ncbi:hypothetical protein SAMN05216574_104136 [Blastococcus tunisiensis]|uniref:DUF6318 domain-containing protein n=1 Tax=Blastococcus tunisiensis TaxID=1798228 RepID=A0A1I2BEX0_9ACTN|nr:hypothetical protein SAMN05216574_104136 [Blastococcus sp. DSM 46838]